MKIRQRGLHRTIVIINLFKKVFFSFTVLSKIMGVWLGTKNVGVVG